MCLSLPPYNGNAMLQNSIFQIFQTCPLLAGYQTPWDITAQAAGLVSRMLATLDGDFVIRNQIAIHREAVLEEGVVLKPPAIISKGCFIAAHAYLRGGVFLAENVSIGPGGEVKSSFIFQNSALAHFNFVGDSLIGTDVNLEAGAVLANHFNERPDKTIRVVADGRIVETGVHKFGALVSDGSRIGANAVTVPGTILLPGSIVGRLQLLDQVAAFGR